MAVCFCAPIEMAAQSPFDAPALRRAVQNMPVQTPARDPAAEWQRVERLAAGTTITVRADTQPATTGVLVSANAAGVTFIPNGASAAQTLRREAVVELQVRTVSRGSTRGAIIGASVGAGLGFLSALVLSYRDCGGDCTDERALIGVSLVGMPVGGGLIGFYAFPGRPRIETIYRR